LPCDAIALTAANRHSFVPPEFALGEIFRKARQEAPCYLVFEDLDSLVTDRVRSFFLNEVDGMQSNDGILMVGSTNHLERLDPGIAKRPSRFDRKFFFPNPNLEQRVHYCHFWQTKLKTGGNEDIDFPDQLCVSIAKITDAFSFAYIQEAFVAALVVIAGSREDGAEAKLRAESVPLDQWEFVEEDDTRPAHADRHGGGDDDGPDLDKYLLWRVIKEQIAILRKELNDRGDFANTAE
jgi:transitional endoplasmic reticulum ATPase